MIKFLTLISMVFFLTSCSAISDYVKVSANEKTFDSKGFKAKKRLPMYNRKYIQRAAVNVENKNLERPVNEISNNNYEADELKNYSKSNQQMYLDMARMNENKKAIQKYKYNNAHLKDFDNDTKDTKVENNLKKELKAIKKMLEETKKTFASYKCPISNSFDDNDIKPNKEQQNKDKLDGDFGKVVTVEKSSKQDVEDVYLNKNNNFCTCNEKLQVTECRN